MKEHMMHGFQGEGADIHHRQSEYLFIVYFIIMDLVSVIKPSDLAEIIRSKCEKVLIIDARTFCEYNTCHIVNAINFWSSKIRKKRLQQNSISIHDFLQQSCPVSLQDIDFEEVVVYDQSAVSPHLVPPDTFLHVLLVKLTSTFNKVCLLQGGFLEFQSQYYEMCEDSSQKGFLLTSFSQPCLPVDNNGPTKILPFLFLGSQHDANNKQILLEHNISHELNVSTSCPKPDFLQESHFFRIAVNDNFSAKLLPHFEEAFRFIDKVREIGGRVLVHCLAGISRSPTVVISYVMKYLHLHYDEAYRYVKTRRPTISPNINFVGQLLEFDLHLFGGRAVFRSSAVPSYSDNDPVSNVSTSRCHSPLLKSSSSSCLDTGSEPEFGIFSLEGRFTPLRLTKSFDAVPCLLTHQSMFARASECDDDYLNEFKGYKKYVSNRLPSSPVSSPSTPDCPFKFLEEKCSSDNVGKSHVPFQEFTNLINLSCEDSSSDSSLTKQRKRLFAESEGAQAGSEETLIEDVVQKVPPHSLEVDENHDQRPSFSPAIPDDPKTTLVQEDSKTSACHSPTSDRSCLRGDNKRVWDTKCGQVNLPNYSIEEKREVSETDSVLKEENSNVKENVPPVTLTESCREKQSGGHFRTHYLSHSKSVPLPHAASDDEEVAFSSEHDRHPKDSSFVLPPKSSRIPSRKPELPHHLPRSHSSSETYLNTRTRLEKQAATAAAASSTGGSNARKSFSSDEMGRNFQTGHPPPPTAPSSAGFHKESYTNPLELARCDSWSTSGLGSEISDWDSIQGDAQSMDDAQGPFDAVFAEVFPGESSSGTGKDQLRKYFGKKSKSEDKPEIHDSKKLPTERKSVNSTRIPSRSCSFSRKSGSTLAPEDTLGSSPTPRPVSLPGVSGTYNVTDNNANVDMGVEIDDSRDWQKEPCDIFHFSPCIKRRHLPMEHPPVNPRTMGDDVKYIMTWYKIDASSQLPGSPKENSSLKPADVQTPSAKQDKNLIGENVDNKCRHEVFRDRKTSEEAEASHPKEDESSGFNEYLERTSLHDRWKWWDRELQKKIQNIKKNVCLAPWDSVDTDSTEEDDEKYTSSSLTGYHLAQELVQSMEDLLEREIYDIKKQASNLSARFGLPVTPLKEPSLGTCKDNILSRDPSDCSSSSKCRKASIDGSDAPETVPCPVVDVPHHPKESVLLPCEKNVKSIFSFCARAKSEPPICLEDNLYRVKSCPGISERKGVEDNLKSTMSEIGAALRSPKLLFTQSGHSKRYSCSALDFLPTSFPLFESCPDVSRPSPLKRGTRSSGSGDSSSSSTHSSFRRLLKVS